MDQIEYGEDLQTANQHFRHAGTLQGDGDVSIIGHGTDIAETGTDIADAGDGGGHARDEIQAEGDIDSRENDHDEQVAEDIAEGVADLLVVADPAVHADMLDAVGAERLGDFAADAFGGQDGPRSASFGRKPQPQRLRSFLSCILV